MKNAEIAPENGDFETSLATLEKIVRELERGEMPLEKSLELFEQGIRLSRECDERLNAAERRIEVLLRGADGRTFAMNVAGEGGGSAAEGFDDDTDEADDDDEVF